MTLSNAFTNFFNCLNVPTIVLNNKFDVISTYKSDTNIKNSFYTPKAIDKIKNHSFKPGILKLDLCHNIKYSCIMFSHYNNTEMYILIGPYTIEGDYNFEKDILCIKLYYIDILFWMVVFLNM